MSERKFLALYLAAPFQSWGYASKFDYRTTLAFPTRSGVIGMLCAAAGVDRKDSAGLAKINGVSVSAYVFSQGTRLTDYQTIGGGYDKKADPQAVCAIANTGRPGDTVQTWREYLQNARFGILVGGEGALIDSLAAAVRDPVWGIWLGRKNCIPAEPLFAGVCADEAEAVGCLRRRAGDREPRACVLEAGTFDEGTDTLPDYPLDFAARAFAPRRVKTE